MNRPRGLQPRHHEVILPDHAWGRYLERAGVDLKPWQEKKVRVKLRQYLTARLNDEIAAGGLILDRTGAAWIEITPVLWATVRLGDGGWVITTFTDWSEKSREVG